MGWPISKIHTELSGWEYTFYQVLEQYELFGENRADYRAARIIQAIAGIFSKRVPPMKKIMDMFDFGPGIEQSDEEIEIIFNQASDVSGQK